MQVVLTAEKTGPRFEVAYRGEPLLIATLGNLCLVIWRGQSSPEAERAIESVMGPLLRRSPKGAVILSVVEETAPALTNEQRRRSAEGIQRMAQAGLLGVAGVIHERGFTASIARAVITSIALIMRQPCPFRAFTRVEEALVWLDSLLGRCGAPRFEPRAVAAAVAHCRAQYLDISGSEPPTPTSGSIRRLGGSDRV